MKNYPSRIGPFAERPYYSKDEIETICSDELRACGLLPAAPSPIRAERFVEKRFGVILSYEDLPEGVLGFTRFAANGVDSIVISRALDSDGSKTAERRIRTTIAHEAGHGLLHAHLFGPTAARQATFADFSEPAKPKILCRNEVAAPAVSRAPYQGKWWEYQANLVIGALLLPRALAIMGLEPFVTQAGLLGTKLLDEPRRETAVRSLADIFDVNPQVARIRLQEIYPLTNTAQLSL